MRKKKVERTPRTATTVGGSTGVLQENVQKGETHTVEEEEDWRLGTSKVMRNRLSEAGINNRQAAIRGMPEASQEDGQTAPRKPQAAPHTRQTPENCPNNIHKSGRTIRRNVLDLYPGGGRSGESPSISAHSPPRTANRILGASHTQTIHKHRPSCKEQHQKHKIRTHKSKQ